MKSHEVKINFLMGIIVGLKKMDCNFKGSSLAKTSSTNARLML